MAGFRGVYWESTGTTDDVEYVRSVQLNETRRTLEDQTDKDVSPTVVCVIKNLGTGEIECRDPVQAKTLFEKKKLDDLAFSESTCTESAGGPVAYAFTNCFVTGWGQGGMVGEVHGTTLSITFENVTAT